MSASPKAIKQAPILTMAEAEALLSRLSQVIPALMAIIEQETALVRAGHLTAAMRLEPRKAQLSGLYLSDAARVKASSHYLNQQLPARCRELRRKHDDLVLALEGRPKRISKLSTCALPSGSNRTACSTHF